MPGRRRSLLAFDWYRQMVVLLEQTARPWAVDELLEVVCGRRLLTAVEQQAAGDALARLLARPDVRHGRQPPSSNGEAAA